MANTLTNLVPDLFEVLDVVSRELVGLIPSVSGSFTAQRAAKDQTIRNPVAPASSAADVTPGQNPPDTGDQTIGNTTLTISKSRAVPVRWNGEEQIGQNTGAGYRNVLRNQFEQAFRTLTNEVETDLASLYSSASRAYGAAGTTPFGTAGDFSDASQALKILKDNGAPSGDVSLVLNTTHGANLLGKQARADVQGSDSFLRQGIFLSQAGMAVRESGQLGSDHTAGTATSATTDNAGYAVGATTITLASAGSGTILAGDVVTFAGDANKYVVATGDASVSGGGTIVLPEPGLRVAMSAATKAITVTAAYDYSMLFSRDAISLATRVPARPEEGDSANDAVMITDPRSGLTFEVAMYSEYRQVHYEVSLAWGYAVNKVAHLGLLIG